MSYEEYLRPAVVLRDVSQFFKKVLKFLFELDKII